MGAEARDLVPTHLWQMSALGILLHLVNVGKFWKVYFGVFFVFFYLGTHIDA